MFRVVRLGPIVGGSWDLVSNEYLSWVYYYPHCLLPFALVTSY